MIHISSASTDPVMDDLSDAGSEFLCHGDMQKFVWAVGIGVWSQNTGHHELGIGEFLRQKSHKRNAAATTHRHCRCAKKRCGSLLEGLFQRILGQWRMPTRIGYLQFKRYLAAIRRIWVSRRVSSCAAVAASVVGGRRNASFTAVDGRKTLPASCNAGMPSTPVTSREARHELLRTSSVGSSDIGWQSPS